MSLLIVVSQALCQHITQVDLESVQDVSGKVLHLLAAWFLIGRFYRLATDQQTM